MEWWKPFTPSDQLAVIDERTARHLTSEERVIELRNAQIANRIQLHLALGGSFGAAIPVAEFV